MASLSEPFFFLGETHNLIMKRHQKVQICANNFKAGVNIPGYLLFLMRHVYTRSLNTDAGEETIPRPVLGGTFGHLHGLLSQPPRQTITLLKLTYSASIFKPALPATSDFTFL